MAGHDDEGRDTSETLGVVYIIRWDVQNRDMVGERRHTSTQLSSLLLGPAEAMVVAALGRIDPREVKGSDRRANIVAEKIYIIRSTM